LAHLSAEEHAELLAVLDSRQGGRDYPKGPDHPLWNRPRSRSLWPGQHARCGVCGGRMYRYGKNLRCQNAVPQGPRTCWNHVHVEMSIIHAKVLPWVLGVLEDQPAARAALIQAAWQEFDRVRRRNQKSGVDMDERIAELEAEGANLATAIARGGNLEALVKKAAEVDAVLREAREEKARLDRQAREAGEFVSLEEIASRLGEALARMARTSLDFADFLRRLVPVFTIHPVQGLDRPQVRPRARLTLRPDAWAAGGGPAQEVSVTLDLFDPPEYVKHLSSCVALKEARPKASYDVIARELGINTENAAEM
jgi:hypothetical protein